MRLMQGKRTYRTVRASVGDRSSGCGASSGCRLSVVVRCSRSKLCFSSDEGNKGEARAGT